MRVRALDQELASDPEQDPESVLDPESGLESESDPALVSDPELALGPESESDWVRDLRLSRRRNDRVHLPGGSR